MSKVGRTDRSALIGSHCAGCSRRNYAKTQVVEHIVICVDKQHLDRGPARHDQRWVTLSANSGGKHIIFGSRDCCNADDFLPEGQSFTVGRNMAWRFGPLGSGQGTGRERLRRGSGKCERTARNSHSAASRPDRATAAGASKRPKRKSSVMRSPPKSQQNKEDTKKQNVRKWPRTARDGNGRVENQPAEKAARRRALTQVECRSLGLRCRGRPGRWGGTRPSRNRASGCFQT